VTIHDLAERFGVSPRTIHSWRERHGMPPPTGGKCHARYGPEHVEWIQAWQAHRHHFVSGAEALAFCRENGISLREYHLLRERAVREFGIGVA
jgi:DNA-binding transcriptional MerR regulator